MSKRKDSKWDLFFYNDSHPLCNNSNKEVIEIIKTINKSRGDLKILDIGCGAGNDLINIYDNIKNKKVDLTGIDFSKQAILKAQERSKKRKINFIQSTIEQIPFKEESFDIIYSFLLFHCLKNKQITNLLREIIFLLKKQGICLIKTRSKKDFLYNTEQLSNRIMKDELIHSFFSQKEFNDLLSYFFKKVITKENTFLDTTHSRPHTHSFLYAKCYK